MILARHLFYSWSILKYYKSSSAEGRFIMILYIICDNVEFVLCICSYFLFIPTYSLNQRTIALISWSNKMEIFPEMQIKSEFLRGSSIYDACPPPSLSHSSASLSPPPTFATPAMCKLCLNGCGGDALCLLALWVMSGSPCIAVNMEPECCRVSRAFSGRIWRWKILLSQYRSRFCDSIRWPKTIALPWRLWYFIYLFIYYDHVRGGGGGVCRVTRMMGMCSRRALEAGAGLCCPLQAVESHWTSRGAQLRWSDIIIFSRVISCVTISSLSYTLFLNWPRLNCMWLSFN